MFHSIIKMRAATTATLFAGLVVGCSEEDGALQSNGSNDQANAPAEVSAPLSADPVPAPLNLRAFVGGNDIALQWSKASKPPAGTYYRVYRDGALIGEVLHGTSPGTGTAHYVDRKNLEKGRTYKYEVQTVFGSGQSSPLSASVTATHPTAGFPVPTIIIDDSAAPAIRPYLEQGKAVLETWYPKIADLIAFPDYTPDLTITIKAEHPTPKSDGSDGGCAAGWVYPGTPVLHICDIMAPKPGQVGDFSVFVHESTHIIQNYKDAPGALWEGIASWAGDLSQGIEQPPPPSTSTYMNGYAHSEYFYAWIATTYGKPNFIRDMNVLAHKSPFKYDWFKSITGKNVNELWQIMTEDALSMPARLTLQAGVCARASDTLKLGTPIVLSTCEAYDDRTFVFEPGLRRLHVDAHCISASDNGRVTYEACDTSPNQRWSFSNGLWVNAKTMACLQPEGGATATETALVTARCTGAAVQKWNSFPL